MPPLPTEVNPALPMALNDMLLKGLAKHPDDRYHSAEELVSEFERAICKSLTVPVQMQLRTPNPVTSATALQTISLPPSPPPRRSSLVLLAASVVVLLSLLLAGAVFSRAGNDSGVVTPGKPLPLSSSTILPAAMVSTLPSTTVASAPASTWTAAPTVITSTLFSATKEAQLSLPGWISGAQGANLRAGPGTIYGILEWLDLGTPVQILNRNADTTWLLVESGPETQGWVLASLVQTDGDLSQLTIILVGEITPIAPINGSYNGSSGGTSTGNGGSLLPPNPPITGASGGRGDSGVGNSGNGSAGNGNGHGNGSGNGHGNGGGG
jgi:uncharacterized protein YraI